MSPELGRIPFSTLFHCYRTIECGTMTVQTSSFCNRLILHFHFLFPPFISVADNFSVLSFYRWVPPLMIFLVSPIKHVAEFILLLKLVNDSSSSLVLLVTCLCPQDARNLFLSYPYTTIIIP